MNDLPENELLARAKAGDEFAQEAMEEIVRRHRPRVRAVSAAYGPTMREDAYQAGVVAVLEAVHSYEDRGHQFSTYIRWEVRNATQREHHTNHNVGITGRRENVNLSRVEEEYAPEEVTQAPDLDRTSMLPRVREACQAIKDTLCDIDQDILDTRLLADEPATLSTIAARYGISRRAVFCREKKLLKTLKPVLREFASLVR